MWLFRRLANRGFAQENLANFPRCWRLEYHRQMTQHSINEAAKLVSRDRKSLYRAIKEGRLTATLSATGQKEVSTSELIRVYGELKPISDKGHSRATVTTPQRETPDATAQLALLQAELRHARELLAVRESQIEDLRRTLLLLEDRRWWKKRFWPW